MGYRQYTHFERLEWLKKCLNRPPGQTVEEWSKGKDVDPSASAVHQWSKAIFGVGFRYLNMSQVDRALAEANGNQYASTSRAEGLEKPGGLIERARRLAKDNDVGQLGRLGALERENADLKAALKRREEMILELLDELESMRS